MLTQKIYRLADHLREHKKDKHSRRGLQAMIERRRKLLKFLKRKNFEEYKLLIDKLGLKDRY